MARIHTIFQKYADPFGYLAAEGLMYRFAGSALNTTATGATSFATTTPTFLMVVPAATQYAVIPAEMTLSQAGTVAGGAITYLMEMDNANRYTSGGTAMTVFNSHGKTIPSGIAMYSTVGSAITATNAVGIRMDGALLGPDVSPAEGAITAVKWQASNGPDCLIPTSALGATWLINTSAGVTGPTWLFSFKAAVVPLDWFS